MVPVAGPKERKRLITSSPFREVKMLEERKDRRQPQILGFAEEEQLFAVPPDNIRALAVLILETGLRSGRRRSLSSGPTMTLFSGRSTLENQRRSRELGQSRCPTVAKRNYCDGFLA